MQNQFYVSLIKYMIMISNNHNRTLEKRYPIYKFTTFIFINTIIYMNTCNLWCQNKCGSHLQASMSGLQVDYRYCSFQSYIRDTFSKIKAIPWDLAQKTSCSSMPYPWLLTPPHFRIYTSIAHWIKNHIRRTSEYTILYNLHNI